jgi:hypothetical protein
MSPVEPLSFDFAGFSRNSRGVSALNEGRKQGSVGAGASQDVRDA